MVPAVPPWALAVLQQESKGYWNPVVVVDGVVLAVEVVQPWIVDASSGVQVEVQVATSSLEVMMGSSLYLYLGLASSLVGFDVQTVVV